MSITGKFGINSRTGLAVAGLALVITAQYGLHRDAVNTYTVKRFLREDITYSMPSETTLMRKSAEVERSKKLDEDRAYKGLEIRKTDNKDISAWPIMTLCGFYLAFLACIDALYDSNKAGSNQTFFRGDIHLTVKSGNEAIHLVK